MLSPAIVTRLEKIAIDNGFDRDVSRGATWLGFASTQSPLRLWLTADGERPIVALSQLNAFKGLAAEGDTRTEALPAGAAGAIAVVSFESLHHIVRRAFQLSKTL